MTSTVVQRIRTLLAATDLADPEEIAGKLLAEMDVPARAEAFGEVAPSVVSWTITRDRMRLTREPSSDDGLVDGLDDDGEDEDTRPTRPLPTPKGQSSGGDSTPSTPLQTKADRIANWYADHLRQRMLGTEEWRLLGEFSVEDHQAAAQRRRDRAAGNLFFAQWHERAAEEMSRHEVDRFEDLPPAVLAELIAARKVAK